MCSFEFEMSVPLDLTKLKVLPLAQRRSLARLEDTLVDPDSAPPSCSKPNQALIRQCVLDITQARAKKAAVMLIYGAHLIKNGAALILIRLLQEKWITHLATNGAGAIHDWEFAYRGLSTERHNALLVSLAAYAQDAVVLVHIHKVQTGQLTHAKTRGVQQFQNRAVPTQQQRIFQL